jgi:hypothetical protein
MRFENGTGRSGSLISSAARDSLEARTRVKGSYRMKSHQLVDRRFGIHPSAVVGGQVLD